MFFQSAIPFYPQYIDGRFLQMEADIYLLEKHQIDDLVLSFVDWCNRIINNQCIAHWHWGQKRISGKEVPHKIKENGAYSFSVDADVISSVIYNAKSFREFDKRLLFDGSCSLSNSDLSIDYFDFFEQCFRTAPRAPDDWKNGLLKLFYEQGRVCLNTIHHHDIIASAFVCPYYSTPSLYHGTVTFRILGFCLPGEISALANQMVELLEEWSAGFININARVSFSPIGPPASSSAHMMYFGGNVSQDGSHTQMGFTPSEWYKYYYLLGAEWYNLVSPLAQGHIPTLLTASVLYPSLNIRKLSAGGIAVQVNKRIELVDVSDLLDVKLVLYNALYPGMMIVPKNYLLSREMIGSITKPRKRWELIPVLDEEIIIQDEHIIFKNLNSSK